MKDMFMAVICALGMMLFLICVAIISIAIFTGCTLSFTNVSTHGNASDLIDEEQTTSPDVKTDLTLPVKGI